MSSPALTALDAAAQRVGDRWSLLVLGALGDGQLRYGELKQALPAISTNVLAQRLAALEAAGLVIAEPYSRRPVRVSYALTADGRGLMPALAALTAWGAEQEGDEDAAQLRHAECGGPLAVRWHCPACGVDVAPDAPEALLGLDDAAAFRA